MIRPILKYQEDVFSSLFCIPRKKQNIQEYFNFGTFKTPVKSTLLSRDKNILSRDTSFMSRRSDIMLWLLHI